MRIVVTTLFFLVIAIASTNVAALTFRREGDRIEATGTFEKGDTARFAAFIRSQQPDAIGWPAISLNSSGGSLTEGILLGRLLRQYSIASLVKRGDECFSACAVAFLGGTQAYGSGSGVGRYLEVGAKLGFHGFSSGTERVVLLNEAFDVARIINGVIVQYASDMKGVDIALLSELVTVEPRSIRIVNTPRELRGLGIVVKGPMPSRPANWALNACGRHVEEARPLKDGPLDGRISSKSERIVVGGQAEFRQMLLTELYGEATRQLLASLPPAELIWLAINTAPKYPLQRIAVQRGAGLYYDYCYAFEREFAVGSVETVLVSDLGDGSKATRFHGPLGWYADNSPLW